MKTIRAIEVKAIESKSDFEEIQPYNIISFEMGKAEAILHVVQNDKKIHYIVPLTNKKEMQNCHNFLKSFNVGVNDGFYKGYNFNLFQYSFHESLELLKVKKVLDSMGTTITAFQVSCCLWNNMGILERTYKDAIKNNTLTPWVERAVARINEMRDEKLSKKQVNKAVKSC